MQPDDLAYAREWRVKVVGWGGIKEMPVDISSYNGGEVKQLSKEFTKYPVFKTTADLRWNFNEMYVRSDTDMPREFLRLEPATSE